MLQLVHFIASWYLKKRMDHVQWFMEHPHEVQHKVFRHLVTQGALTSFGSEHGLTADMSRRAFVEQVPVRSYEGLFPWIERAFQGEENILWPEAIKWFAKSSGTTNDISKYIPVSHESMELCHFHAGQDMLAIYFHNNPDSKLFTGKSLSIGGSHQPNPFNPEIRLGDVSAVLTENLPIVYELARTPSKEVALLSDWEEKIHKMYEEVAFEDVTSIAGVPTWTLVLIRYLLEHRGIDSGNLLEIWPNLELYLHGGVGFDPYRTQFKQLIPSSQMNYMDCYNASEGFFGLQNDLNDPNLLLLLDYGIYYEFIPMSELGKDFPQALALEEIELGENYAMAITTNGGLWRYLIGDTIMFTSDNPYKFRITGRTKHFINAFGEELMVDNADRAISEASQETAAIVKDYTAGPIYFEGDAGKGGHEWLIEFDQAPKDFDAFCRKLDDTLRVLNSDYAAKRQGDIALAFPKIHQVPIGTFHNWMKKRGKLGGQNKVPRLANNRNYVDEILEDLSNPAS
ncbi:GH3 auxin-responsive promoter family protein [Pontibacter sp. G13]|uniref:GH3 auxin-responsive promoter family protein n=1 Tax=Pontibacter sp. G13 TaxID=3074898 RepID=UPI002889A5FD|nr:GH3 auxin-responsive promoter family protein [Pontibacter sp. G13]WNJ21220.1 GH3 auxin-responsive promoter family protein [Pontibacter sp. G13]